LKLNGKITAKRTKIRAKKQGEEVKLARIDGEKSFHT
jgi:hypothetical protein